MREFIENSDPERNTHIEKALKEAGLKVEEVAKQGKKTVITVSRNTKEKSSDSRGMKK